MEETRSACKILVGILQRKIQFGRHGQRQKDNIETNIFKKKSVKLLTGLNWIWLWSIGGFL
jgi:hypothetical protein